MMDRISVCVGAEVMVSGPPNLVPQKELESIGVRVIKNVDEVLKIDSANCEAIHSIAVMEFQEGNLREAERLLKKAIRVNPMASRYYTNLGRVLKAKGRVERSIQAYKMAVK